MADARKNDIKREPISEDLDKHDDGDDDDSPLSSGDVADLAKPLKEEVRTEIWVGTKGERSKQGRYKVREKSEAEGEERSLCELSMKRECAHRKLETGGDIVPRTERSVREETTEWVHICESSKKTLNRSCTEYSATSCKAPSYQKKERNVQQKYEKKKEKETIRKD